MSRRVLVPDPSRPRLRLAGSASAPAGSRPRTDLLPGRPSHRKAAPGEQPAPRRRSHLRARRAVLAAVKREGVAAEAAHAPGADPRPPPVGASSLADPGRRCPARAGHRRLAAPGEAAGRNCRRSPTLGRPRESRPWRKGKFDKANQLLSAAREAVVALGGAVEHAGEIRQAADEAAIFVNLLSDSSRVCSTRRPGPVPRPGPPGSTRSYKGRSVIIDATITATPETSSKHRYEIDYLVLTPGKGPEEPPRAAST